MNSHLSSYIARCIRNEENTSHHLEIRLSYVLSSKLEDAKSTQTLVLGALYTVESL
jgi:hypothetical protein